MQVNWTQFFLNLALALGALSALIWLGGCSTRITPGQCLDLAAETCADVTINMLMTVCPEETELFIDEILKSEREGSI